MVDEWRAFQGLPPLPNGAGQVFLVPRTLEVVPAADFGSRPAPAPMLDDGTATARVNGTKADHLPAVLKDELATSRPRGRDVPLNDLDDLLHAKPQGALSTEDEHDATPRQEMA
jgi:hypothetical protein